VVQGNLPADRIDYYALLDDGEVLTLSNETRYSGFQGGAPPHLVRTTLGKSREEWVQAHQAKPASEAPAILHANAFCIRADDNGGNFLTLPLHYPAQQRFNAAAIIHLERSIPITREVEQVIQQIAIPLQVALEREVIYRTIEAERQKAYQRSIRDPLTGLFNRVYMHDAMQRHCSIHDRDETTPVAAVMIDLDYFKRINDTHGHAAGDDVLRQIAQVLRENVRGSDIAVRYGGEEFILFLVGASAFGAADYGERIRSAVERHVFALDNGPRLRITASVGVAVRDRYEPLNALIRRADEALYQAKGAGRNRVELARARR
jgi:diguanylate cyclase (GGDEF)-like protein